MKIKTKKKASGHRRKPAASKNSGEIKKPAAKAGEHVSLLFKNSCAMDLEKTRLSGLVSDLSRVRDDLDKKLRQQTNSIRIKNNQLKKGVVTQAKSEEQIYLCTIAMEAAADGIFIIDAAKPNFPVYYANQAFQNMTGYVRREIIGQDYFSLYGVDADRRVIDEIKRTISQGKIFHGEMFNFQKSGKKYWDLLRIAPVRNARGVVTHYVGIRTDITSMREKELQIAEQRDELLHVTRVGKLAEFVSSLAHEINQPLTAILSYAQAAQRMLENGQSPGQASELMDIIKYIIEDDKRAADVIQRMRTLLKKNRPEMKSIDINSLINETGTLISTDAIVRNVFLKYDLASGLPFVQGDRVQLQQVLLNLISNSFDAMESNQEPREILFSTLSGADNTVLVTVRDSGSGVTAQNMPKLFTHFFTSKPDGLGMGLSISRSIVEAHGGQMSVKNNTDRGVTFHFNIPVFKRGS
jgi:two-component system sensor kinase FixL